MKPVPQRSDVEETDPPDRYEDIANGVAVVMVAVMAVHGLASLMSGASRSYFGLYDVPIPERLITDYPILAIGIPCAVLAVALCIKKRRAASRTGVNGDCEDGGTAEVLDDFVEASHDRALVGSDGAGEHGVVRGAPVVTIPSSSSSSRSGGVSAGSGLVTAADVELGGASHHRRGERRRGVDMSREAIRDGKGKNA
ncbi:hypothetical protein COCNU_02G000970 [Cocos nucifera]|uniref:Uncharacterized protein n=1 Tax=Cocos nucifera TaxID=13894 RepID=A0A8K0HXP5_COCNU|nr:hypothetical protein COCNU_02G000970 [Cocos nucifera]